MEKARETQSRTNKAKRYRVSKKMDSAEFEVRDGRHSRVKEKEKETNKSGRQQGDIVTKNKNIQEKEIVETEID